MTILDTLIPGGINVRQQSVDALIQANRFVTAGDEGKQDRKVQRLTIQDINAMSKSSTLQHLKALEKTDNRSPIMRFIDVIDLPRNTVANMVYGEATPEGIIATIGGSAAGGALAGAIGGAGAFSVPGAVIGGAYGAGVAAIGLGLGYLASLAMPDDQDTILREARMGSLGQRVLTGSDILRSMGVENRVVRAVVGFGGDVLMDPLTYLSGGGNVVFKGGANGAARLTMSKVGHLKIRDAAEEIIRRGGQLPTEGPLSQFNHLFAEGLEVGNDIIAKTEVDKILGEIRKADLTNKQIAKQLRGQLTEAITDNIKRYGRSNPLQGPVHEIRGAVARDFMRQYAAASSHQFTFPLSGFTSNVLRKELGYKTLDVPIGRFGLQGSLKKALGKSEDAFVEAVKKDSATKLAELRSLRDEIAGGRVFTASKVVAASLPESIRSAAAVSGDTVYIPIEKLSKAERDIVMATDGVAPLADYKFDPVQLDRVNKDLKQYDDAAREALEEDAWQTQMAARIGLIRAERDHLRAADGIEASVALADDTMNVAAAELNDVINARISLGRSIEEYKEFVGDATLKVVDRAMDVHNAWTRDDAAIALAGPSSLIANMWKGNAEHFDLQNQLARATSVRDNEIAALSRQKRNIHRRIRDVDPDFDPRSVDVSIARMEQRAVTRSDIAQQLTEARTVLRNPEAGKYSIPVPFVDEDVWKSVLRSGEKLQHSFKIKKGAGAGASNAGKTQKFDLSFEDQLDRLVYVATSKDAKTFSEKAVVREANELAQLIYGVSKATVGRYGKALREEVERGIGATRSAGDAGVSAGAAEVGRAFVVKPSAQTAKRRSFNINTESKSKDGIQDLFDFGPVKSQGALNQFEKMADKAIEQAAVATNEKTKMRQWMNDLSDIDALEGSIRQGYRDAVTPINTRIEELEASNPYKLIRSLELQQRGFRDLFGFGRRNTTENIDIDLFRRRLENLAQLNRDNIMRSFDGDIKALKKDVANAAGEDIDMAVLALMTDKAADNGKMVFADEIDEFGNPMDAIVPKINELRKNPEYLNPDGTHALLDHPKVLEMAEKYQAQLDEFYRLEQAAGVAPNVDPSMMYLPIRPTDKVRAAVREHNLFEAKKAGNGGKINPKQAFTQKRSTNYHIYTLIDDNGRPVMKNGRPVRRKIYTSSLDNVDHPRVHEFEKWRQWEIGRQGYDSNWRPESIPTSPFQLNRDRDQFEFLSQLPAEMNPFETDILTLLGARTFEHHKAIASKKLTDDTLLKHGRMLTEDEFRAYPKGIAAGSKVIDGVEMRRLKPDVVNESLLELPIPQGMLAHIVVPEKMAAAIEDFAQYYSKRENVAAIGKVLDKTLSFWKTTKLFNPSWLTTNVVSNVIMATAIGGMRISQLPYLMSKTLPGVRKIHGLHGDRTLSNATKIEVGGMLIGEKDLYMRAAELGIVNAGQTVHEITSLIRMGDEVGNNIKKMVTSKGNPFARIIGKWYQVNAAVDDGMRMMLWTDLINQGHSMEEAARKTIHTLFDYSDLTRFEDRVMRRVFPFYRWLKFNSALQFHTALRQPAFATSFPKLQNALETAFVDEDRIPQEMRPRWIRDQLGVQIDNNPNARFLMLGSGTPINELFEIGQGLMGQGGQAEMLKYFASAGHPMVRMLTEIAFGEVLFTGEPIEASADPVKFGYGRTALEHVGREFMPLAFTAKVVDVGSKHSFGDAATRFFMGGRYQIQTPEQVSTSAHFEWSETLAGAKQQIKKYVEDGEEQAAADLANAVIQRYRVLWDQGLTDTVPKFLRQQFAQELRGAERPQITPSTFK